MNKEDVIKLYLGEEIDNEFLNSFPDLSESQREKFDQYKLENTKNMKPFFAVTYALGKKFENSKPQTKEEDTLEEVRLKYQKVRYEISENDLSDNFKSTKEFDANLSDLNSFENVEDMIKEFNSRRKKYTQDILLILSNEDLSSNTYQDYLILNDGIEEVSKNYVDQFETLGLFSHAGSYDELVDANVSIADVNKLGGLYPKNVEERKEKILFLTSEIKEQYMKVVSQIKRDYISYYPDKEGEIDSIINSFSDEKIEWGEGNKAWCDRNNKVVRFSEGSSILQGIHEYVHYFQHILREIFPYLQDLRSKGVNKYDSYFETGILSQIMSYFSNNFAMPDEFQASKVTTKFFVETVKKAIFKNKIIKGDKEFNRIKDSEQKEARGIVSSKELGWFL